MRREPRFDIEPLITLAGSVTALAEVSGINRRTLVKYRAEGGVTPQAADRCAAGLHMHPLEVWPEAWQAWLDEVAEAKRLRKSEANRRYRERNRERLRQYHRDLYRADRDGRISYAQAYYRIKRDEVKRRVAEYERANREAVNARKRARYAARRQEAS